MEYRKCTKCKREKPYYEFYYGIDGSVDNTCIKCEREELEITNIINGGIDYDRERNKIK